LGSLFLGEPFSWGAAIVFLGFAGLFFAGVTFFFLIVICPHDQ
jgi:hypothetical protein